MAFGRKIFILKISIFLWAMVLPFATTAIADSEADKKPVATKIEEEYIRKGYVFFPPRQIADRSAPQTNEIESADSATKINEPQKKNNDSTLEKKKKEKSLILIIEQ
jgi:hypothetical protein